MKNQKNQLAAAIAALTTSIDWGRLDGDVLQSLIEAANQGLLNEPITEWIAKQEWRKGPICGWNFKPRRNPFPIASVSNEFTEWFYDVVSPRTNRIVRPLECGERCSFLGVAKQISEKPGAWEHHLTSISEIWSMLELHCSNGNRSSLSSSFGFNIFFVAQPVDGFTSWNRKFFYRVSDEATKYEEFCSINPMLRNGTNWLVVRAVLVAFDQSRGWNIDVRSLDKLSIPSQIILIDGSNRLFSPGTLT